MFHCYQLSINEREEISLGLAQKFSKNYIALSLGRSSSTICREVNRNTANGQAYRAVKAQGRANELRHLARKSRKMDINLPLKHYVLEHLDQLWSPEQIELCQMLRPDPFSSFSSSFASYLIEFFSKNLAACFLFLFLSILAVKDQVNYKFFLSF